MKTELEGSLGVDGSTDEKGSVSRGALSAHSKTGHAHASLHVTNMGSTVILKCNLKRVMIYVLVNIEGFKFVQ